jgi:putative ABC transport system permease protein
VLAGLGVGLLGALSLGRIVSSVLFRVGPHDPWTVGVVAATLTVVSATACHLPARRTTVANPLRASRDE